MARFCPNCGTEVDDTASFCPACGQPLEPPAYEPEGGGPASWAPPPVGSPAAPYETASEPGQRRDAPGWEPPPWQPPPAPPAEPPAPPPTASGAATAGQPQAPRDAAPPGAPQPGTAGPGPIEVHLPITWPLTLSGWLIGVGALVAAIGAVIALFNIFNPVHLVVAVLLLAVATAVFFSASLPSIPHVRLLTLLLVVLAAGVALDRIGFGSAGIGEVLFLLGAGAAAVGAALLELGRDQPLAGPIRRG